MDKLDRFQFSENFSGPWLELIEGGYNNPTQAMASARASFPTWDIVFVAKMRPLDHTDLFPPPEQMLGDAMEKVSLKHGSSIADQVWHTLLENSSAWSGGLAWLRLDKAIAESNVWVPDIIHGYKKDQPVRTGHFSQDAQEQATDKLKLEDLM